MTSQNVWIGITIGVFLIGLGIGFTVFSNQSMNAFHNQNMFNQMMGQNPQAMTWMMDDPQVRQQMFQQMMQDPEQMMGWMANDPKHIEQMSQIMKENHVFMSKMMSTVINDPDLRLQMVGHMSENPEALKQMMSMLGSGNMTNNMMGNNMMGQMQGQNESTQTDTTSYVKMVDGVQVVTINAKEFKFTPSELNISAGKTKFVLINDGVGEHELVIFEASKQDIIIQAEIDEDEETIEQNILFEIEEVHGGESGESEVMDLTKGSYVIGCLIPGHYEAGMKGTLLINP